MYNLIVAGNTEFWNSSPSEFSVERIFEYTKPDIEKLHEISNPEAVDKLKSYPTIFAVEQHEHYKIPPFIGYIEKINIPIRRARHREVEIHFTRDPILPSLPIDIFNPSNEALLSMLDIIDWEFNRTHWALKDKDLFKVLTKKDFLKREQIEASNDRRKKNNLQIAKTNKVFIVHGRDDSIIQEVSDFIKSKKLEPIVLRDQASEGMTVIEKFEKHTNVNFAVILYTPCDFGSLNSPNQNIESRARQNVVFEHGYLMSKIGRGKVVPLVRGSVDLPTDISSILHIKYNSTNEWKEKLEQELRAKSIL